MEGSRFFQADGVEYKLYQAASGDYCVTVARYGEVELSYNLGSLEDAYAFILADFEVK